MSHNRYPSRTRRATAGVLLAGGALLASLTNHNSPQSHKVSEATAQAPESDRTALNKRAENAMYFFAGGINSLYEKASEAQRFARPDSEDPTRFYVGVIIEAGSNAGGDYGEYFLEAKMKKDAKGRFDPTSTSSIFIGMDARTNNGDNQSGYGHLASLSIFPVHFDGIDSWRVIHAATNQDGQRTVVHDSTEPEAGASLGVLQALDSTKLTSVTHQFTDVLKAAAQRTPVERLAA